MARLLVPGRQDLSIPLTMLIGIVGSFVLTIPNLGYESIDTSFLAMAPNVVTIVAMAIFATRVRQPSALARPFLFGLDPERAHELTLDSIATLQNL